MPVTVIAGGGTPLPMPTPETPTPIPSLPSGLSPTELKYRLLKEYPDFFYCDPDFYPIARADEGALARQHFVELQANAEEFTTILNQNGLGGLTAFSDEQKLLIYHEHKKLAAIHFQLVDSQYQFQLQTKDQNNQGFLIKGLIDGQGKITVQERSPGIATCPICLAASTQIDTPRGPIAVADLKIGDRVWTVSLNGERILAPVLKTVRVPVPYQHPMIHLVLVDGRELWASLGHPTTDRRRLGDLKAGDILDGARIQRVEIMPYDQPATYDLLPSGGTGFYWANGILIASTLAQP